MVEEDEKEEDAEEVVEQNIHFYCYANGRVKI